jgi:antitoxin (DNA-binding transcriptional repressor) of toxin-antitoxin stability system
MDTIGVRQFRERLSGVLASATPLAITRHGQTVGFYIPARRNRQVADLEALRRAGEQLEALIAAAGANEEGLLHDFQKLRRPARRRRR